MATERRSAIGKIACPTITPFRTTQNLWNALTLGKLAACCPDSYRVDWASSTHLYASMTLSMMVQDFVHRSMRYLSTAFRQYLRTTNCLPKNARGMIDEISESLPAHFPESLCSYLLPDPSYPEQFPSNLDCRIHGTLPL